MNDLDRDEGFEESKVQAKIKGKAQGADEDNGGPAGSDDDYSDDGFDNDSPGENTRDDAK